MRRFLLLVLFAASACNLNNQPTTPTQPLEATEAETTPDVSPTPLPGINATAGVTPNVYAHAVRHHWRQRRADDTIYRAN